jgi:hypothetical protein
MRNGHLGAHFVYCLPEALPGSKLLDTLVIELYLQPMVYNQRQA